MKTKENTCNIYLYRRASCSGSYMAPLNRTTIYKKHYTTEAPSMGMNPGDLSEQSSYE